MSININKLALLSIMFLSFSANISVAGVNFGIALLVILFIVDILNDKDNIKRIKKISISLNYSVLAFLLILIISIFFSTDMNLSLEYLDKIPRYLFLYISIIYFINEKKELKLIINIFSISLIISSIYSIYQYFYLNIPRASGFIPTLTNASVILLILPLVISKFYTEKKLHLKVYYLLTTGFAGTSLLVSNTRGSWLAFIVGLIVFAFLTNKKILVYFFVLVLLIIFLFPNFYVRFLSIFDLDNLSNNERILMWKSAINMWQDRPIIGHGLGTFKELYPKKYILEYAKVSSRRFAHSNILTLLAETGILGLLLYLNVFLNIFKYGFKNIIEFNLRNKITVYGFYFSFLGFFIHGLTFTNLLISHSANIFWVILALYVTKLRLISLQ